MMGNTGKVAAPSRLSFSGEQRRGASATSKRFIYEEIVAHDNAIPTYSG